MINLKNVLKNTFSLFWFFLYACIGIMIKPSPIIFPILCVSILPVYIRKENWWLYLILIPLGVLLESFLIALSEEVSKEW